jgi:tetratricopeptide (TPR) repeat protein
MLLKVCRSLVQGLALTGLVAGALTCVASAQETDLEQQLKVCQGETAGANPVTADAKIAACTALLQSDRLTTRGKADVYVWRSEGYSVKGDSADEMSDLDLAIKADPTDANAWAQSCSVHTWSGNQTAQALKECTTAIQLAPDAASPWTFRGDIYLTQHDYKRAIADYDRALKLDASWMWPWDNRGEAYLRLGNIAQAIQDFHQVIKVAPDYSMGYLDLGIAEVKRKNAPAALSDFQAALKIQPKCAPCLYGRGLAKVMMGDQAGGRADIAQAKTISQNAPKMFQEDGVSTP